MGEVDEVVPDNIVVKVLRGNPLEVDVNHPLQDGVVVVDELDVEPLRRVPVARDADMGGTVGVGKFAVAPMGVRHHDRPFSHMPVKDARQLLAGRLAEVGNPADGLASEVDAASHADLFLRETPLLGVTAAPVRLAGHLESP